MDGSSGGKEAQPVQLTEGYNGLPASSPSAAAAEAAKNESAPVRGDIAGESQEEQYRDLIPKRPSTPKQQSPRNEVDISANEDIRTRSGAPDGHSKAIPVDSSIAQLEAQLLETKTKLSLLEQSAGQHASDRYKMSTMLQSEHVLAPMPHLLADVEKIFDGIKVPHKWHPTENLGYYTDLAINSLTRHLDRLQYEKKQLETLENEMRRLRAIETQYESIRAYKAQDPDRVYVGQPSNLKTKRQDIQERRLDPIENPHSPGSYSIASSISDLPPSPLGDKEEIAGPPSQEVVPRSNSLEWADFKAAVDMNRIRTPFAIDVLKGEPVVSFEEEQNFWWLVNKSTKGRGTKPSVMPALQRPAMSPGQAPLPERIRINSDAILVFLYIVFSTDAPLLLNEPLVMIRPYKALVCSEREIRERFSTYCEEDSNYKDEVDQEDTKKLNIEAVDGGLHSASDKQQAPTAMAAHLAQAADESASESWISSSKNRGQTQDLKVGNPELKCLMDFMEQIRQKLAYIESPQCQTIFFADFWYMFKPGDEIVEQSRTQAFRIIKISGGGHRVTPPWRTFETLDSSPDDDCIVLHCIYISFDGKKIGPVNRVFRIQRWDGDKDVVSLPVFPLRYMVDKSREETRTTAEEAIKAVRDRLIARGKMYLDVTTRDFKHMHYSGLTMGGDDVDSHVVIDFNQAFVLKRFTDRPRLENLISIGQSLDQAVPGSKKKPCEAECCRLDLIFEDEFVEQKRSREYLAGLMPQDSDKEPPLAIYPRDSHSLKYSVATIPDGDLVIMDFRAPGFVLRSRKWAWLDLTYLTPPNVNDRGSHIQGTASEIKTSQKNARDFADLGISMQTGVPGGDGATTMKMETAFDQLVLPEGHKRMLLSLIAQHFRDKEATTRRQAIDDDEVDIVRGKGKGLIILLHGAPGVGKTSTAGDLGTTAEDIDLNLGRHFNLANKWGCVLLLDEADVFLASRSKEDFVRNGLVSVFLRVLEYYAGILFLTTNRIGDFDEAFTSRIHISLYYPQLQLESTKEIFKLNFRLIHKRFAKKSRRISIDEDQILEAVEEYWNSHDKERWNGRQIRNACQTALALAEFDAQGGSYEQVLDEKAEVRLKVEHIMTVSTAYLGFMDYLSKVRDKDDERWAKVLKIRARERDLLVGDGPPPPPPPASTSIPIPRNPPSESSMMKSPMVAPAVPPGQKPPTGGGGPNPQAHAPPQAGGAYPPYQWPGAYPWPAGYPPMPPPPGAPGYPPATAIPGVSNPQQAPPQGWGAPPQASGPWPGYAGGYGSQPSASGTS